ncbi:MAG: histidine phosphatase family protein [Pseudolabrys sp.]|nr:histidine phosphatase family protein [Pseudolabrys sp.]
MRRLLLLRHAKTEPATLTHEDRSRALIERGRRDAGKIGAYMQTHALVPDRVVLSPAKRVQETWKYMAGALKRAPGATTAEPVYAATPHDILGIILGAPAAAHSLMIIGHNPSLQDVALMLIASGDIDTRELLREKLPTAGLVIIDFPFDEWRNVHPQSGRLERFVTPKSLEVGTR